MYTKQITLNHNELPAKVSQETGEITVLSKRPNNIPEGKEIFEPDALFKKNYNKSWELLRKEFTALEFKAAFSLALMAKANSNSLEPLNDETTYKELVEVLDVSKNKIEAVLKKLWLYGVYGKFEVYDETKPYTKYWILNPYLSFSGKLINSDIANLFRGTKIARHYYSI